MAGAALSAALMVAPVACSEAPSPASDSPGSGGSSNTGASGTGAAGTGAAGPGVGGTGAVGTGAVGTGAIGTGASASSAGGTGGALGTGGATNTAPPHVLVYSRTSGFRHDSIEPGVQLLSQLATESGAAFTHTEDEATFVAGLAQATCVVFMNTSEDVLGTESEAAFQAWFEAGGGFVGIHAASDTEYDWPFYGELVGAYFQGHPHIQDATIEVEDGSHPSTAHLGATWSRNDEWYNFVANPREGVHVLLTLDESSYEGGSMGEDHPIAWYQELGAGRSFYTALGHTAASYAEPDFVAHLRGGLSWALRLN